jgi:hypothetical protein
MDEASTAQLLTTLNEIRDLLRLLAEPAIAERDKKLRSELRRMVGNSVAKRKAALLMDGTRTQRAIHREGGIDEGNLSTFVKQLKAAKLISGDRTEPRLSISVPANFFDQEAVDE